MTVVIKQRKGWSKGERAKIKKENRMIPKMDEFCKS